MNYSLGRRLKNFIRVQFFYKKKLEPAKNEVFEDASGDKSRFKRIYYDDGSLKAEIHTRNGKLHGQANLYYESGTIKAREFYRDNNLQGISRWYYESGDLQSEKYFDKGTHIYTKQYDKNGRLVREIKN